MYNNLPMNDEQQFMISEPMPMGGLSPVDSEQAGPSIIHSLWRFRWTMVLVSMLLAAVVLPAVWFLVKPKYEVTSMIHIAPFVRAILFSDPNTDVTRDYHQYMGTEAATVVSPAVIDMALDRSEVRSLPAVVDALDPVLAIGTRLVARHVKGTQLLKVSMLGEKPKDMELIVNAVVETYLRRNNEKQRSWDEKILSSLRKEETELDTKLEIKARQLQRTAVDHGLGGAEPSSISLDSWMGELRQLLTQAKKEQAIADAKIVAHRKAIEIQIQQQATNTPQSAEFESFLANHPGLQRLQDELRRVELSALDDHRLGRGPDHPDIQGRPELIAALTNRIDTKKADLATTFSISRKRTLQSSILQLEDEYTDAKITVRVLTEELEKIKAQQSDVAGQLFVLENLRHERQRLEESLRMVKEKIWNVEVEQNRAQRITLESPATSPKRPNIDKRFKYAAAALMFCFFSGMGAAMLRGRLDMSFQNSAEITERLGVRVLGSVEYVGEEIVAPRALDHRITEPIRGISAALLASSKDKGTHTKLITSPTPGTGKSSLASNLAYSLAATGRKVLLVDADNEGRGVTRRMNLQDKPGLTDLLAGTMTAESLLQPSDVDQLKIMPAGEQHPQFGELLSSREGQQRLMSLLEDYDEVIFDSPPVLARSDAVLLATIVQEVILVLRAGKSTRDEALAAQQYLAAVGGNVVGVILNAVDPKNSRHGYGYGYGYSYSSDYQEMKS